MSEYSAHLGRRAGSGNKEVDGGRGWEFSNMHCNVNEIRQMQGCD